MMMQVLIVEDDAKLAVILKDIVEIDGLHNVTGIVSDLDGALAAIDAQRPQLALIDLHLAGPSTGVEVAARARERDVQTLFTSANPLPFPVPELALGCLCKPYDCYSVAQSLNIVERLIAGSRPVADEIPADLELY